MHTENSHTIRRSLVHSK